MRGTPARPVDGWAGETLHPVSAPLEIAPPCLAPPVSAIVLPPERAG